MRKIPLNHRNVTGYIGSKKSGYAAAESTLEADFLTLLDFDYNVTSFTVQPVTIQYNPYDSRNTYTPDVKVVYQNGSVVYFEVKYRNDLFNNWQRLKPKFKCAIKFAKANGAKFKIITEQEIRTPYLKNIQFLKTFLDSRTINTKYCQQIEDIIKKHISTTPADLLNLLDEHQLNKAEWLYMIWAIIAAGEQGKIKIKSDLSKPISINTKIWWKNEN